MNAFAKERVVLLEGLLECDPAHFLDEQDLSPGELVSAKHRSAALLEELGVPPDANIEAEVGRRTAREAFGAMVLGSSVQEQRDAVLRLETPEAVKHLVGMLTAYDWEFVAHAGEIRSFVVAKLLEETSNPSASARLRALEDLGKVTEVALFTERSEVKHVNVSDAELEDQLRAKLARYGGLLKPIIDAE